MSQDDGSERSEALMRDALPGAGTSVWEWDVRSVRLTNSQASMAVMGHSHEGLEPVQETWNRYIHPEDLVANHEAWLRHARGAVPHRARRWRWPSGCAASCATCRAWSTSTAPCPTAVVSSRSSARAPSPCSASNRRR